MPVRLSCDDIAASDVVARYVAGKASEQESEALELHVLECEACAADLRSAVEFRAALVEDVPVASTAEVGTSSKSRRRSLLVGLAVAASLFVAVGIVWERNRRPIPVTILRGPEDGFTLAMDWQPDGSLKVAWEALPGATSYRIHLSSPDTAEITDQVQQPSSTIPASRFSSLAHATIEVEAENAA